MKLKWPQLAEVSPMGCYSNSNASAKRHSTPFIQTAPHIHLASPGMEKESHLDAR